MLSLSSELGPGPCGPDVMGWQQMGPSNQTLHERQWHQCSLPRQLHPGEPGHGQAATDHVSFDFFSDISPFPKHQAAAETRGRAFMTPALPLFSTAGRAGVSLPLHPCRTTVLVCMSCTRHLQWPLQPAHFSYHSMGHRVHSSLMAITRAAQG